MNLTNVRKSTGFRGYCLGDSVNVQRHIVTVVAQCQRVQLLVRIGLLYGFIGEAVLDEMAESRLQMAQHLLNQIGRLALQRVGQCGQHIGGLLDDVQRQLIVTHLGADC